MDSEVRLEAIVREMKRVWPEADDRILRLLSSCAFPIATANMVPLAVPDEYAGLVLEAARLCNWLLENNIDMKLPDDIGNPERFGDAIQSLASTVADLRMRLITADCEWQEQAEKVADLERQLAEVREVLGLWIKYDDQDEADFAKVGPMLLYAEAINATRAQLARQGD